MGNLSTGVDNMLKRLPLHSGFVLEILMAFSPSES